MRKYEIVYTNGRIASFEAEMDTVKEGVVILSRKKEFKGPIARADEKPEIVRVISLTNIDDYGYVEIA